MSVTAKINSLLPFSPPYPGVLDVSVETTELSLLPLLMKNAILVLLTPAHPTLVVPIADFLVAGIPSSIEAKNVMKETLPPEFLADVALDALNHTAVTEL